MFDKKTDQKSAKIFKKDEKKAAQQGLTQADKEYIRSKDYNYGLRNGSTQPMGNGFIGKLRRKVQPFVQWIHRIRHRLEDSTRKRRQIIYGTLVTGMVLSAIVGVLWNNQILVSSTPMSTAKMFVNGDTIQAVNKIYDPQNHVIRLDLQTSSTSGVISPKELSARYQVIAAKNVYKQHKLPQMYLVPTFNNHYIVIFKHIYSGFKGINIIFKDKTTISVTSLAHALSNDSNGIAHATDEDSLKSQHLGAYEFSQHDINLITNHEGDANQNNNDANYSSSKNGVDNNVATTPIKVTKQELKMVNEAQKNNRQNLVYTESSLKKHHGHLSANVSPKQLALSDLNQEISKLQGDIATQKQLMAKSKPYMASLEKKIRDLAKDIKVDPTARGKISAARSEIQSAQDDNTSRVQKMVTDRTWISRYREQIHGIKTGNDQIQTQVNPSKGSNFNTALKH